MRLLVLTSEYPNRHSTHDTPVVHYFAKEWVRQGHEVVVVHSRSVFPAPFYPIARAAQSLVKKVFKTDFIPFHRLKAAERGTMDGVDVATMPIFKAFPHLRFGDGVIRRHAAAIETLCRHKGFVPDLVVCHFLNPQLPLIPEIKRRFPRAKASLVIHEDPAIIASLFGARTRTLLDSCDFLGFRYASMRDRFVAEHGDRPGLFICPSGVPAQYLLEAVPAGKFRSAPLTFCFVGMLIPLKNVDVLLQALHEAFPARDFRLRIVGEGFLKPDLEALTASLGLTDCVRFEGRMSRDAVQSVLAESDVFVMVSKPEAFGLSYLEAMGKGCVTIGTRGQGIDGIIVSGENGYLCDARDVADLRAVLSEIAAVSYDRRRAMGEAALRTACGMSDAQVAADYLATLGGGAAAPDARPTAAVLPSRG
ncbi:MAG TPA: glycosyltransferase family 4 protein [Gemmatimonadaceae bacterium]|nr:glycosyltransferase family 4 protein [Gemmatimonadaceae bacterium]